MSTGRVMPIEYFPQITGERLAVMRDQGFIFVAKNNLISVLDHDLKLHHTFEACSDKTVECVLRILNIKKELVCVTKSGTHNWDISNPIQPTLKHRAVIGSGQCVCTNAQKFQLQDEHANITVIGQDRSCLIPKPGEFSWLYTSSTMLFVADITSAAVHIYQAPLEHDKKKLSLVIPEKGILYDLAATDKTLVVFGERLGYVYNITEKGTTLLYNIHITRDEIVKVISEQRFAIYTISSPLSLIMIYDAKFSDPTHALIVDVGKIADLTLLNSGKLYVLGSQKSALVEML